MPFRRVLKKAMQTTMDAGAAGVKVQLSGRIGGAEIARTEWYKEGSVPLHIIRANIDYAPGRAETTYGSIGVKVWIYKGEEILPQVGA
jgi:small subunit ribosomal protein S3